MTGDLLFIYLSKWNTKKSQNNHRICWFVNIFDDSSKKLREIKDIICKCSWTHWSPIYHCCPHRVAWKSVERIGRQYSIIIKWEIGWWLSVGKGWWHCWCCYWHCWCCWWPCWCPSWSSPWRPASPPPSTRNRPHFCQLSWKQPVMRKWNECLFSFYGFSSILSFVYALVIIIYENGTFGIDMAL